jgi:hypothetical protein
MDGLLLLSSLASYLGEQHSVLSPCRVSEAHEVCVWRLTSTRFASICALCFPARQSTRQCHWREC